MLSIIVPVYNEEDTVAKILKKLSALSIEKEIIVINDGSVDGTQSVIESIGKDLPQLKYIKLDRNFGKGNAIQEGIKIATGDIIAIQDADLEYEPQDLISLLRILKEQAAQVIYGLRFKTGSEDPFWHRYVNKFLSFLTTVLYFREVSDMETCYKVMYKKIWQELDLKSQRFEVEAEITAKVLRRKFKFIQHPIQYKFRNYKAGKKISWLDGLKAVFALFKYRFKY